MGWMRIRAGSNVPRTVTVTYNLTGLTTNGASTASAYTSFSFVLLSGGNRVPPDTIRIWVGGVFQAQGIGYTYNKDTGAVTIRNVVGDIVVEAIGKIATVIWSPAVGYDKMAILSVSAGAYYIIWYSETATQWKIPKITGSGGLVPPGTQAEATIVVSYASPNDQYFYISNSFSTLSSAEEALYRENGATYTGKTLHTISSTRSVGYAPVVRSGEIPILTYVSNTNTPSYHLTSGRVSLGRGPSGQVTGVSVSSTYSSTPTNPTLFTEYDTIKYQS